MIADTTIRPPNSLLFVMDTKSGDIPEAINGKLVVSTSSCVVVCTLTAADGETSVVLTDERSCVSSATGMRKVFDGVVATPRGMIEICTVLLRPILTLAAPNTQSKVEIWANADIEPDRLCVLIAS